MVKRSKRKHGRRHPGVVILPPDAARRIGWRIRYRDPDSGKLKKETLSSLLTTQEARQDFAARKSRQIAKRKLELAEGASRATGMPLAEAVDRFFRDHPRLRPRTLRIYRDASDKLVSWAGTNRVRTVDDLTGPRLVEFKASLAAEPRHAATKGGKRGAYKVTEQARSESTVNVEIRAVATVLNYLRRLGLLPKLTSDNLKDGLKQLPVARERIEFLRTPEIRALLHAALKHDAATFKVTRAEHRKGGPAVGSTIRHEPIGPFCAFLLLTGMRFGEAIDLEWSQIDCETIHLEAGDTKTKIARSVDLNATPAVVDLLKALGNREDRADGGDGRVFAAISRDVAADSAKRLKEKFGAPPAFSWQGLRRTCSTWLTNSAVYGAATPWHAAKRAGHSLAVAESRYAGLVRVDPDAKTIESAMKVEAEVAKVIHVAKASSGSAAPLRNKNQASKIRPVSAGKGTPAVR